MICLPVSNRCLAYDRRNCICRCGLHGGGDSGDSAETILSGLAAAAYLTPIAATLNELFQKTALPSAYLEILWKALGICYLTGIAGDLCQDCGESALAHMAELWGRFSLLLLALPLLQTLLETVTEVMT